MSDIEQIRRRNLCTMGYTAEQLTSRLGGRDAYWRRLLQGVEPFSALTARRIELAYGYPDEALDCAQGLLVRLQMHEEMVKKAAEAKKAEARAARRAASRPRREPVFA